MKNLIHLQQFKVAVEGSTLKRFVDNGVEHHYYRNFFKLGDKYYSFKSPENCGGKGAVVQFIEKGKPHPNGSGVVVNDCFSLLFTTNPGDTLRARKALEELNSI